MAIYTEETADFIWRNGEIIPWAEAYRRVVEGRDDRHPEWRTPVWGQRQ
jgi:hypothetical protein